MTSYNLTHGHGQTTVGTLGGGGTMQARLSNRHAPDARVPLVPCPSLCWRFSTMPTWPGPSLFRLGRDDAETLRCQPGPGRFLHGAVSMLMEKQGKIHSSAITSQVIWAEKWEFTGWLQLYAIIWRFLNFTNCHVLKLGAMRCDQKTLRVPMCSCFCRSCHMYAILLLLFVYPQIPIKVPSNHH